MNALRRHVSKTTGSPDCRTAAMPLLTYNYTDLNFIYSQTYLQRAPWGRSKMISRGRWSLFTLNHIVWPLFKGCC